MQFLLDFANENPRVREVVQEFSEYPTFQGATLDVDGDWLRLWRLREKLGDEGLIRWLDRNYLYRREAWYSRFLDEELLPGRPLRLPDLSWTPPVPMPYSDWPIVLRISMRSSEESEYVSRDRIYQPESSFRVEVEIRPIAHLLGSRRRHNPLVGGVSISTGHKNGTLGGILCQGSKCFGMTCAHVAELGEPVFHPEKGKRLAHIGVCSHQSVLSPGYSTSACNPWNPNIKLNKNDVSLVELSTKCVAEVHELGAVSRTLRKRELSPKQNVVVVGNNSKKKYLQLGGLGLVYRFKQDEECYDFGDIYELRWPTGLRRMFGFPIVPGDSGAWVCMPAADGGLGWAGLVFASDWWSGYAIPAETIKTWWESQGPQFDFGFTL